jgi:molybdenum cofactor guanylyltransferase
MIAGLILAGGAGRRMGGVDKAFLRLGGQTLIERAILLLRPQTAALAISARDRPERFAAFGLPVVLDGPNADRGPLGGIAAGLRWARTVPGIDALLTLPVDTPFAPADLAARLAPAAGTAGHGETRHHLVALWPVAALGAIEAQLAGPGPYRIRDAAATIGARLVAFAEPEDPFMNLNTPADLAAAQRRLGTPG